MGFCTNFKSLTTLSIKVSTVQKTGPYRPFLQQYKKTGTFEFASFFVSFNRCDLYLTEQIFSQSLWTVTIGRQLRAYMYCKLYI